MTDERLARGLMKRFLHDIECRQPAFKHDLDRLADRVPRNVKALNRAACRLSKRHDIAIPGQVHRHKGSLTSVLPFWSVGEIAAPDNGYRESGGLSALGLVVKLTRTGGDGYVINPLIIHPHALKRLIERDTKLPSYDLAAWLDYLSPAVATALHFIDSPVREQGVALPTMGGLFVAFMLPTRFYSLEAWTVSVHSFYGQYELEEDQQDLHAQLPAAARDDADAILAAHRDHGSLWTGQRPKLLRAAEEARLNP